MKKNEYKCELCKGVFKKGWSDKEMLVEMERDFPNLPEEERAVVCDDCYNALIPIQPSGYYSPWSTQ